MFIQCQSFVAEFSGFVAKRIRKKAPSGRVVYLSMSTLFTIFWLRKTAPMSSIGSSMKKLNLSTQVFLMRLSFELEKILSARFGEIPHQHCEKLFYKSVINIFRISNSCTKFLCTKISHEVIFCDTPDLSICASRTAPTMVDLSLLLLNYCRTLNSIKVSFQ